MKINDIQKKEWFELASFDDNILKDGLLEIGLTKNEISKIKSQFGNYKKENLPEEIVKPSQGENIGPAGVGVACTASALGCTASAIARGACLVGGSLGYLFDLKKKEDKEFELKNKLSDFLKERLGFLKFETKSEIVINVKIPLFKWNSPMVEGSEILYETKNTESLDNTFGLTIFGLGLGKTYKLSFSSSNSFICSNGSFKQIYIPVALIGTSGSR